MLGIIESEIIIFLSFLISSVAGFAGAAIAVPMCTAIMGLSNAKAVVNIISIAFNSTIVLQHKNNIKIKELIPVLVLVMVGMVTGMIFNEIVKAEGILIKILGGIILVITLIRLFTDKELKLSKAVAVIILMLSGMVNYLFMCGGIVMVLYMSTRYKDKELFRAGNSFLFLIQSLYMLGIQYVKGVYTKDNIMIGLIGVLPVIVATIIGKHVVNIISQERFEKITYVLLIIMAITLLI